MRMTITIELSTQTEKRLRRQAELRGKDLESFAQSILDNSLRPLRETAAPLHKAFEESRMTQEELDVFTDELIREVRAETPLSSR